MKLNNTVDNSLVINADSETCSLTLSFESLLMIVPTIITGK